VLAGLTAAGLALRADGSAQFKAGVDLVEVYVTVTDARGNPVTGLAAADFRVAEDGHPQAIAVFAEGDVPLGVAVAIDHSFSVPNRQLARTVAAAERFLAALKPGDEVMALAVGSRAERLTTLTTDRASVLSALRGLAPWGTTPLHDAVVEAIVHVDAASGRRALVLVTDGVDRYSATSAPEMIEQARRRNVLVYPVVVARTASPALSTLARVTGGRLVVVRDAAALGAELERIAAELRAQYLLGYSPVERPPETPTWRTITVNVQRTGVSVRAREGYLAR
jgi:Ca-activated chloride channel family protein